MTMSPILSSAQIDFSLLQVLVVEDSAGSRRLLEAMLRALKVKRVEVAQSGNEALDLLERFTPDLIITDWHMRPMDGLSMVRNIRRTLEEPTRYLPIIMVTGRAAPEDVKSARDSGANMLLVKPITVAGLAEKIGVLAEEDLQFVEAPRYVGPDRRKQGSPWRAKDSERRKRWI